MRPHFATKRHLAINATLHCTQTCALYNVTWFSDVWCSRGLKSQKWARPLSVLRPDPGLGLYHIKQCNVTAMHCNAMEWHVMFYNEAVGLYYINAMSPNKKCYIMHCTVLQWSLLSVQTPGPGLGLYDISALSPNKKCYLMHCTEFSQSRLQFLGWGFTTSMHCHLNAII